MTYPVQTAAQLIPPSADLRHRLALALREVGLFVFSAYDLGASRFLADREMRALAAAITILVGLFAGLAPVFMAGKVDLTVALKEGSPTAGTGRRGQAFRDALVVAEMAITLILAFASGLLIRSLVAAETTDPGFNARHLLNIELQLPESRYKGTNCWEKRTHCWIV